MGERWRCYVRPPEWIHNQETDDFENQFGENDVIGRHALDETS